MTHEDFQAQLDEQFNEQVTTAKELDISGFTDTPEPATEPFGEQPPPSKDYELVNQPSHYIWHGIKVISMLQAVLTTEEYLGYLKGTDFVYRMRAGKKPDNSADQDIEKAIKHEEFYNNFVNENTFT